MCFTLSVRNPARTVWTWPQLEPQVEGSVTFDWERCASCHFVTSHQVHLQECVKIEVLCTNGGLDKVYSVYSEYTLKFGFVKVWTKKCTVCYIFGIMWTFDIIMICVVEVLSYNSWIKRKYEIFTFSIMTFVQPHWNVLHAIGFSFLLRISRGHIHKKMSFWWTMYTRPPAPLKYAPVYMYEDFYMHCIDFILSWILRDRWCLQNLFNRALTWKYFLRHIKASTAKIQSISE